MRVHLIRRARVLLAVAESKMNEKNETKPITTASPQSSEQTVEADQRVEAARGYLKRAKAHLSCANEIIRRIVSRKPPIVTEADAFRFAEETHDAIVATRTARDTLVTSKIPD